jgi:DNA-binding NarL/FixJ family response regulator
MIADAEFSGIIHESERQENCKTRSMINVILADHQRIFRIGMASALAAEDDIRIVGQPQSVNQLMHGLEHLHAQVLVLSTAYLARIDEIRHVCHCRQTAILLLEEPGEAAVPQFSPDVQGFMRRSADENTVVRCIRHLARGGRVLRLVRGHPNEAALDPVGVRVRQRLTPNELRIIAFVVQGYRNREIASRMGMTESGVKNSLRKIFDKTGVFDRLELALYVMHHQALKHAASEVQPTPRFASIAAIEAERWNSSRDIIH